jgi:UDPglucose 6-dehydrogenase
MGARIGVIGAGYVGLVTGACLASLGHQVTLRDIDPAKVELIAAGEPPIHEDGLKQLMHECRDRLRATLDMKEMLEASEIVFIAVDTPPTHSGDADLSRVMTVLDEIEAIGAGSGHVLVMKSTVPVGTGERVRAELDKRGLSDIGYCSNPEFLKEGVAIADFLSPDRVVVGDFRAADGDRVAALYEPLGAPILRTSVPTAEMIKYASNAFLATKITFMNEIANFCERVGADVDLVRRGIGTDTRIGSRFLFPGIGYGGSCFPKDVQALHRSGREAGFAFHILESVMHINEAQKTVLFDPMRDFFAGQMQDLHIALWGLAFKPETDDIREAPALYMIERLLEAGAKVTAFDPEAMPNVRQRFGDRIAFANSPMEALSGADALLICTEWQVFRNPDFEAMKRAMKRPVIFDGRNLYDLDRMQETGFYYKSIGRSTVHPLTV